MDKYIVNAVIR